MSLQLKQEIFDKYLRVEFTGTRTPRKEVEINI